MHGNITSKSATQAAPLDQLGAEIMARVEAGDRAKAKADDHYLAAGLRLLEAQSRVTDFSAFLKNHCRDLKRSRAYQLMRVAGGKATIESERAKAAERVRKHRAAKCALRNGHRARPSNSKRTTALDVIELWMQMPASEDRRVFEAIGLRRILAGLPDAWKDKIEEWVDDRRSTPPVMVELGTKHQIIPGDLSVPPFLQRAPA